MRFGRRWGSSRSRSRITDDFHRLYYEARERTWFQTSWLGTRAQKCPLDLWVYQEIIYERRPDTIVETGTAWGGSAFFLASMCDLVGNGRVITIDIGAAEERPQHERVSYLRGSSIDPEIAQQVRAAIRDDDRVMVILDSDHSRDHVLEELKTYAPLVTPGDYCIVEDTNVNGNPILPEFGPGPAEAVAAFLRETNDYEVDRSKEKFFMTFNPRGYWRKRR